MTSNPNLNRMLRNTFYSMSRRYGAQATIFRVDSHETDLVTGEKTRSITSEVVRNCVQIPVQLQRQVMFTASMMQSLRPFAWQGGAGQEVEQTMFLILKDDLRDWGEVTPYQYINFKGGNFQLIEVQTFDGGWIMAAKRARGTESGINVTVDDANVVGDENSEVVE